MGVLDAEGSCVEDALEVGEMRISHFGELEAVRDLRRASGAGSGSVVPDDTRCGFENFATEETHAKLKTRARFERGVGHDASADFGKVAHDPVGNGNVVFE